MTDFAKATEQELRDADVPWPDSAEELTAFIATLVNRQHDYGTCVYAMSLVAVAAFRYVAGHLGVTGFQASCADMDLIRRTRSMKGPFTIVDVSKALYPQYDLVGDLRRYLAESGDWLRDEARKLLKDPHAESAHPDVIAHWRMLAEETTEVLP